MNRTFVRALATFAIAGAALPAVAQDAPAVPPDTQKALWCATAFTLVEPQARAQGQTEAADRFKKYADSLNSTSHDGLAKAGFSEDQIKTQTTAYTDKVTKELSGSGAQPEFSVVDCTQLVDPAAAAAIQTGAPGTPGPEASPAPASPTTTAPAAPTTDTTTTPAAPAK